MPLLTPSQSLAAVIPALDKVALVQSGNRITDVSILPEPSGLPYSFYLKLGNNPPMGPITAPCTVQLDRDAPDSDAAEGLSIINLTAQAGVVVPFVISYARQGSKVEGGVRVLQG